MTVRILGAVALALALTGCPGKQPVEAPADEPAPQRDADAPAPTRTETLGAAAVPLHEQVDDAADLLESERPGAAERARDILEGVLDQDPELAIAWFDLGVAHQQLGDHAEARRAYTRAVDLEPSLGEGWLHLGMVQEATGRHDLAISNYRTGMRKAPEHMGLRVALIAALREQGRLDEAIQEAKAALQINSNSLPVYNNLGLAHIEKGQLELAKFVYQKALNSIEGAQDSAYIHANLGWSHFQAGRTAQAEYYLTKAVELDPELVPALSYLSRIHLDNRNYADMIPLLERAFDKQPGNVGVAMNLGIAYRGVGRYADAERMYRRALELQPRSPDPWFNLGILFGDHMKDYERGVAAFQSYVELGGEKADLATEYIDDLAEEQERAAKKRELEEERRRREREREERQRLLEQAEDQQGQPERAPADNPWTAPAEPSDSPEAEEAEEAEEDSPWGSMEDE